MGVLYCREWGGKAKPPPHTTNAGVVETMREYTHTQKHTEEAHLEELLEVRVSISMLVTSEWIFFGCWWLHADWWARESTCSRTFETDVNHTNCK